MTLLPDQYLPASLVNGKPTCTFAPAPFHRTITNIVVGNTVQGGVKVYRASLSSVPAAQNPLGINNTLSGSIRLPAGQILFIQWDNVGAGGAKDAFARVSFVDASDNPLADSPDTQAWSLDQVSILVLPTGATTGARIVLDATTDMIQIFDASNHLVVQIDPSGLIAGNDLSNVAAANFIRMNVTDAFLSNPGLEIQPGTSFAGTWHAAILNTFLLNSGVAAEQQALTVIAPAVPAFPTLNAEILLSSGAHDGSAAGDIQMFADDYILWNHDGSIKRVEIDNNGNVINDTIGGGYSIAEGTDAKMGRAVLVAGSVTVTTFQITDASEVFLTCQIPGGTPGALRVDSRNSGANTFVIKSSNAADTSTVAWMIVEPS